MVLAYHEVVPEPSPYLYSTTCAQLEEHLAALRAASRELPHGARTFEITFDDGHASHHRFALEILERHGLPSTAFVTAGWMDNRRGYMSWAQLRELASLGHRVQSHGWSHKRLTACSSAELAHELATSKMEIEDRVGAPVTAISLPDGRWNQRVLAAAAEAGYTHIYTSDPFTGASRHSPVRTCGRLMVRRTTTGADLLRWGAACERRFSSVRIRHRTKQLIRAAIGDGIYHRIWCLLGADATRSDINRIYEAGETRLQ